MGTGKVIQHARCVKVSNPSKVEPTAHQEMRIRAVVQALWVALFEAQQAGLDDVVDHVGSLHLDVVRRLHRLREVA
jgi:hypothetical protein